MTTSEAFGDRPSPPARPIPDPPPAPGTKARPLQVAVAMMLLLGGLGIAIANGSVPTYSATTMAASGSFYALAASGDTLYAASENGGSIVLEKSQDRGVDWSASPVPYSVVAGGEPWTHAAVAVDGSQIVLAASTAGPATWGYGPNTTYPGVAVALARTSGTCAQDSLVLLATSPDGGLTWNTSTFTTVNLTIGSIVASEDGGLAAVAWLGESTACGSAAGSVGTVTSEDGGAHWSSPAYLGPPRASIPYAQGVEIAPESGGIVVAFGITLANQSASALSLWRFSGGFPSGFSPAAQFPAPTSWTLQGAPSTPAYLLTPTYLVPLTNLPYTALPFNQLQDDASSVGQLPAVVSLTPIGGSTVEVAATTANAEGVDCWRVNTQTLDITQTCHVALGSNLLPGVAAMPIVALIDGGGWWIAVGASGPTCAPNCYSGPPGVGVPTAGSGASAGASIGTSVCVTGCGSAQGLAAYSFTESATASRNLLDGVALLLAGAGGIGLIATLWSGSGGPFALFRIRTALPVGEPVPPVGPGSLVRRRYLESLIVWAVAWSPFAVLAFSPGSGASPFLPFVVVLGGALGAAASAPIHHAIRSRLGDAFGLPGLGAIGSDEPRAPAAGSEGMRLVTSVAYVSWLVGGLALLLAAVGLSGGFDTTGAGTNPAGPLPSPGALLLATVVGLFIVLRILYHAGLAAAVSAEERAATDAEHTRRRDRRTALGAALLTLNPLAGLFLGWALQPVIPVSPFLLAWAFLPVTFLGMAILAGFLGESVWSPARA